MKLLRFLMLVVILALPMLVVNAQDEVTEVAPSVGSYVLMAESGTFEEADDDMFTLVLNNVSSMAPWVISLPNLASGLLTTQDLIAFWTFQPELTATAVFTTENESAFLTLSLMSNFSFDPSEGTITFNAEVIAVNSFDPDVDDSKAELPEQFDSVVIFINIDDAFAEGIAAGAQARATGTRDNNQQTCTPTRANNYCK